MAVWPQNSYKSAGQIADSIQKIRSEAEMLWEKKLPTEAELKGSINMLEETLPYLNSPQLRALAQGNYYLSYRKSDVTFDLTNAYARNGQYQQALNSWRASYEYGNSFYEFINKDATLIGFRQFPGYSELYQKFKLRNSLWKNLALQTPFQNELSEDEKIAGLSLLWSQAKYNFVYLDRLTVDWNQTYFDFLPKVRAAKTTVDYYKILQKFYAQLHDGHSNVYPPKELAKDFYSRPSIRTELIEGRVFITVVNSDSLRRAGIIPGLEILKINGEPVIAYAEKYVQPYQSSSTSQDLELRTFSYSLLSGTENIDIRLELINPQQKKWEQSIKRSGYKDTKSSTSLEFKLINDIGYLKINSFEDIDVVKRFDSLYVEISKTKALIIDIRNNGGGDGSIGFNILATLTDKPFKIAASRVKRYSPRHNFTEWVENEAGVWQADKNNRHYTNPVTVLIGPRTFSAAEDFLIAFDSMKRGKMIGQPTGGSTGQPFSFILPGGGTARVCAKEDLYPDGKRFVGIGIQPDIYVSRTIKDELAGIDASLNKSIDYLNKTLKE